MREVLVLENFSLADAFWRMVFSLSLVLVLLVGILWLVRRFLPQRLSRSEGGKIISVIAAHHFGPNRAVVLIDVLGKPILVGLNNQQITYLTTLDDESCRQQLLELRQAELRRPPSRYGLRLWRTRAESLEGKDG
jgi:flagellar biosynthetic protein FliO